MTSAVPAASAKPKRPLSAWAALARPLRGWLGPRLGAALRLGSLKRAERLLRWGADPDARLEAGLTPLTSLHTLGAGRCVPMAELLLGFGADPDRPNADGLRPLHCAAQFANKALCEALLLGGADPELADGAGLSPAQALRAFQAQEPGHHGLDQAGEIASLLERRALQGGAPGSAPGGSRSRL